jgi:hypothetical protein
MATTRIDMVVRERGTLTPMRSHHRGQRRVTYTAPGHGRWITRGEEYTEHGPAITLLQKSRDCVTGGAVTGGSLQAVVSLTGDARSARCGPETKHETGSTRR